jgi:hypothetical protein
VCQKRSFLKGAIWGKSEVGALRCAQLEPSSRRNGLRLTLAPSFGFSGRTWDARLPWTVPQLLQKPEQVEL